MKPIDIFGLNVANKSKAVSATKIQNMYLEKNEMGNLVAYAMPGLDPFIDFGSPIIRGMYVKDDILYVVHRNNFYKVFQNGTYISLGIIDTFENRVEITDNGDQIFIATGISGYIYTISTNTFVKITSAGYNGSNCAQFNSGFFISTRNDSMQFNISGSYDGLNWDALDFSSAENNPDNLITVTVDKGQLMLFGKNSIEFWNISGNPYFPYSSLGASIDLGLEARWSIAKFDNSVTFLATNKNGEVQVMRMDGYTPTKISTLQIETQINRLNTKTDATALTYIFEGHNFYQLSFPTEGVSFCFDATSGIWTTNTSYGLNRHLGEISINWLGNTYISDYANGNLYLLNGNSTTDNGKPIICEIISKTLEFEGNINTLSALQIGFEPGVGNEIVNNPQISLSISRDRGFTWETEQFRSIGARGQYLTSAKWSRLGSGRSFTFKVRITDAIKKVITTAFVS